MHMRGARKVAQRIGKLNLSTDPRALIRSCGDLMVAIDRVRAGGASYKELTKQFGRAPVSLYRSMNKHEADLKNAITDYEKMRVGLKGKQASKKGS